MVTKTMVNPYQKKKRKNPNPPKNPPQFFFVKNKGKFLPKKIRTPQKTPKKNSFFCQK